MTVLIDGDTTGELIKGKPIIGEVVTIRLHDENGMIIEKKGKLKEILED